MIARRLTPVLAALLLFSLTVCFMGPLTQSLVDSFWLKPGVAETIGILPWVPVCRSSIAQHKAMSSPDILPVLGSSEMRSGHGFAPGVVFAGKPTGFTTFYLGGGFYQCLPHLVDLAGQENLRNRKLVILLPSDWFLSGLPSSRFARNFSPLDVYQALFSPSLPAPLRQAIIKRLLQYPRILEHYPVLDSFLKSYEKTGWIAALVRVALWPAARIEFASMQLQDAVMTIRNVKKLNPNMVARNSVTSPLEKPLSWSRLRAQATRQGRAAITNPYGIDDSMLKTLISSKSKDSQRKARIDNSPEYHDLDLLLRVLRAKGAKPLFFILPFNGPFRDFTGFPVNQRQRHYQRLRQMISQYGYPFVDLSSQEYEPYYFNDSVHLSGRAWVDIDEILDDFYHDKLVLIDHVPKYVSANNNPVTPPMPPDPHQKVKRIPPGLGWRWLDNGPYNVSELWIAGDKPDYGMHVWNSAYAFSGCLKDNPRQGFIGTFVPNGASDKSWSGVWKTPGLWGSVRITNVSGNIASFATDSGLIGTFNLDTHDWKKR